MSHVLVTGASGFIAKHIVRELLERRHTVRAGVRSDRAQGQLEALFPEANLEFARIDLLSDEGWPGALQGVDALLHTASPFPGGQPKDPHELIRPAVEGTRRALTAAQAAGVTRVVLTSSVAAVYKDPNKAPGAPSTAENWTDPDGRSTTAYEASKTLAERAAWDFVASHPEMQLTVINPAVVFGVPMDDHYGTSLEYVERIVQGKDPALPKVSVPVVDVRDVAAAHALALEKPEAVGHRFPLSAGTRSMAAMAKVVKESQPQLKVSTREIPDVVIRLMARFDPMIATVAANLGQDAEVDGSDAARVLGVRYTSPEDAVRASAAFLVNRGR